MSEWETFCDECYYHLWRVRRKTERGFYDGFHVQNREEAEALVATLNGLEQKLREARHKRYKSIFRRKEAERERERDEAREAASRLAKQAEQLRKERDELKEALLIMENLLKPGIELFPEIGEILKQGAK